MNAEAAVKLAAVCSDSQWTQPHQTGDFLACTTVQDVESHVALPLAQRVPAGLK